MEELEEGKDGTKVDHWKSSVHMNQHTMMKVLSKKEKKDSPRFKELRNKMNDLRKKNGIDPLEEGPENVAIADRILDTAKKLKQDVTKDDINGRKKDLRQMKQDIKKMELKSVTEGLKVSDGMGAWIDDFQKSDAPQFDGKSDKEKRDMAIAAYMSAKKDLSESSEESVFTKTYNEIMNSEDGDEVSEYILGRRRQMRRTETTGGNNDEY